MKTLHQTAQFTVEPAPFVFKLIPLHNPLSTDAFFAAITSQNQLLVFAAHSNRTLELKSRICHEHIHRGVTCLVPYATNADTNKALSFLTAGRDGRIYHWRNTNPSTHLFEGHGVHTKLRTPRPDEPISALACDASAGLVAAGTEHAEVGPGDVAVYIWDLNNSDTDLPTRMYTQSHSDTITALTFLPRPNPTDAPLLLSASTDGLILSIDTSEPDEDDAVACAINTNGPVAHLQPTQAPPTSRGDDAATPLVWSVSTDEKLSLHDLVTDTRDAPAEQPTHQVVVDVRERLGADYTIAVSSPPRGAKQEGSVLVFAGRNKLDETGSRTSVTAALFKTGDSEDAQKPEVLFRLDDGHGDEVVRDVYVANEFWEGKAGAAVVTVGEDGSVRGWADGEEEDDDEDAEMKGVEGEGEGASGRSGKKRKKKGVKKWERFAPY